MKILMLPVYTFRYTKQHLICFINNRKIKRSYKAVSALKNSYSGKRCFIIGNGPSLTNDDLEKLKNDITFSAHKIYLMFPETSWRPTFYFAQDSNLINACVKDINEKIKAKKIIPLVKTRHYKHLENALYLELKIENFYPDFPKFSENILDKVYEGLTVTYAEIQIAVFMGFTEIYLLGIDHAYSKQLMPDGSVKLDSSVKDYFTDNCSVESIPQTTKSEHAYIAAKQYADKHNIRIVNATRGGALDVFERINYDDIDFLHY